MLFFLRFLTLTLDPRLLGAEVGHCAHCHHEEVLRRHHVQPAWVGYLVLFPTSEALVCSGCGGISRNESWLDRVMSALFLLPFLVIIAGAVGTAGYLLLGMLAAGEVSGGFLLVAVVLLGLGGSSGFFAVRTFRRLLQPRAMLPLTGIVSSL
jgi:hypothetical protein